MTANDACSWVTIASVGGTKEDRSCSGSTHACATCSATVYTGRFPSPIDVAVLCADCAVDTIGAEAQGKTQKRTRGGEDE